MEILLDFVYTETVRVTVENVQELLPAACLLQLKGTGAAVCVPGRPGRFKVKAVETDVGAHMCCLCAEVEFQSQ